ncbi:MAG: hypothetical protein WC197_09000 [Candidatus Gastranaerophilaceae bacterium]|jgi:Mg/Co/Ni transporter MgtE
MITLDTELILSSKYNYLASRRVNASAYQNVEDYSATSSTSNTNNVNTDKKANTNNNTKKFYEEFGYNADNLIRDLMLGNASNRYAILKNMRGVDIDALLPLLSKESIANGLKFFNPNKLLNYISKLPKSSLALILKTIYPNNESFIKLMSKNSISKFLGSDKIDKNQILEYLNKMPDYELSKIIESSTGQPTDKMNQSQMMTSLQGLNKDKFQEALNNLPFDKQVELASSLLQKNEKLFSEFSQDALIKPIADNSKDLIIKGMASLDTGTIAILVQTLPTELLAQVVTQIDPKQFADILLTNYTNLLSEIAI